MIGNLLGTPGNPITPGGAPRTPGNPRSQQPPSSVPSPYPRPASIPPDKKPDPADLKPDPADYKPDFGSIQPSPAVFGLRSDYNPELQQPTTKLADRLLLTKRPHLPTTDYDDETEVDHLTSVYDYTLLSAWLSHPVKRYRGIEPRPSNAKRPMYRRRSQGTLFSANVDIGLSDPIIKSEDSKNIQQVFNILTKEL